MSGQGLTRFMLCNSIWILFALLFYADHFFFGLYIKGDGEFHHDVAMEFAKSLQSGIYYPGWSSGSFGGLGSPVFLVYAPAFHYVFALINALIENSWLSLALIEAISSYCVCVVVYLSLRAVRVSSPVSLIASLLAGYYPFLYMNVLYVQGLPWHFAYIPMALVIAGLMQPLKSFLRLALLLGIGTFFVAVTHVLSAFMLLLCLPFAILPYIVAWNRLVPAQRKQVIAMALTASASVVAGLMMAMFYLWPAITLIEFTNETGYAGDVDWQAGFALPLFTEIRWFIYQWGMGALLLFTLLTGTVFAFLKWREPLTADWFALVSLLSVGWAALFFSSELSYPLWVYSEQLRKVQYAYRFFCIAYLAAVPALALVIYRLPSSAQRLGLKRLSVGTIATLAIATLGLSVAVALKHHFIDGKPLENYVNADRVADARAFLPRSAGTHWQQYHKSGGFPARCEQNQATCQEMSLSPEARKWRVTSSHRWIAQLPLFSAPFWDIAVGEIPITSSPDPQTGVISIELLPGVSDIVATWETPRERKIGAWISLLGVVVFCLLLWRIRYYASRNRIG